MQSMRLSNRPFRTLTIDRGHTVRIALHGELDRGTLLTLAAELRECERTRAPVVVLDLANLTFLDGAAFRLLVDYGRRLRRRGRHVSLVNPSPEVRRILEVGALVHAVDVVDELLHEAPSGL